MKWEMGYSLYFLFSKFRNIKLHFSFVNLSEEFLGALGLKLDGGQHLGRRGNSVEM